MVGFNEFTEMLKEGFEERGYEVKIETVTKNNGIKLTGIILMKPEDTQNVYPNMYLDNCYAAYSKGEISITTIMDEIQEFFDSFEVPKELSDVSLKKEKIIPKVVNKARNESILDDALWLPVEGADDLVITFRMLVSMDEHIASAGLHKKDLVMLKAQGVESLEELYELAKENYQREFGLNLRPMIDLIPVQDKMGVDEAMNEFPMYVLTNKASVNGATGIIYKEYLDEALEKIGCDRVIVLPSSIHEVILIDADNKNTDIDRLSSMVKEINKFVVEEGEVLSDNIYLYDGENLSMAA